MNRRIWAMLHGKHNIRGRLFWFALLSLFCTFITMALMDTVSSYLIGHGVSPLVFLFLYLAYFFLFTRGLLQDLKRLTEGILSIAEGDLQSRVTLDRQDELGIIADSINHMAGQLQRMIEKERLTEQMKMELITNVSHDLRTPLTSLIGYLNLLQQEEAASKEEQLRYLHNACRKTEQLSQLINDLFEYTRLADNRVEIERSRLDLSGLLRQLLVEFEPLAREASLTIRLVHVSQRAIMIMADAELLVRAMDNLLMNAYNFSVRPGEITVRLWEQNYTVWLEIENWGHPITKEQEQRLFERFYKAEASRNDQHDSPGAGLGLSIAYHIARLHRGQLSMSHEEGKFTFRLELPLDGQ
ncbi:HAMP domain-containing sensor histidine kinase [Paenibacillus sp. chi10]|uniref:histidine kinase n=1 Tax=Paenibacillus suaedae TaxID=3077233 RepID=A0AAJ2N646_9BACL|nr:HAMP domain-containing sensor histidine kinase [Paenibacillus sp. chi10]MDT8979392.1 HAMP domain-containing sensor histidine kinase [Paenibacillus sp. chi10]